MPDGVRELLGRGIRAAGGPRRARIVLTLAAALALDGAEKGTASSMAPRRESAFAIGSTRIGQRPGRRRSAGTGPRQGAERV
ncbi:hypothetical protein RKE30_23945 [Streptomyces sp. Li-HN-5-11]|uniref:hypothetical protein n=1 Tax=Streptomyces sp. Li-HN-5-11 TaxID=3075432 RepID=UPI0028A9C7AF|nr:hypothetical protein [Streptomyces sp. Li-HN-5-11]WNM33217.1 hypothetical protein RKE30_23945 [Streptomyces sp. Li-HN-5-11]